MTAPLNKADRLRQALQSLQPQWLDVINESHMHSRGDETHYKVVVVTPAFAGLNAVRRHQQVYAALGDLMGQVHALALHTYTLEEWAQRQGAPDSPRCAGHHP